MRHGLIAAALLCATFAAHGRDTFTGNELYGWRQGDKSLFGTYVVGVVDGVIFQNAISKAGEPAPFCLPPTVNYAQTIDVVGKYLEETPAQRHLAAALLVAAALKNAFPCAK